MLTFSKSGFAQGLEASKEAQSGVEFITMFDKDKDGKVSKQEFSGEDFTSMDKNSDGFIVLEEADQKFNPPEDSVNANQIAFIVKFDENKDGKVSNEEFTGSHFSEFDENGDGFIEPREAPEGETAY
jgi:Ca2+-binding EF-hand superfamily protein